MSFSDEVLRVVSKIPKGKVATYGQIALLAGAPRGARAVGWTLHALGPRQAGQIPWQRVINSRGHVSTTCREHSADTQAKLLKKEGVAVKYKNGSHEVSLKEYLWQA